MLQLVDLNAAAMDLLLLDLTGERIKLAFECEPALWRVKADPAELGRAVMILFRNARKAVPNAGIVTIQTANVTLTEEDARARGLAAGYYAAFAVRDSGAGMDAEPATGVFEPFGAGRDTRNGNGLRLGLAAVRGFAEQRGGAASCLSEPGVGTTFTLLLPAADGTAGHRTGNRGRPATKPENSETVLVVEDEDAIRKLARAILEDDGYTVLDARDGRDGLTLCQSPQHRIDLLLTDMAMPNLGGRELAQGALELRPGLSVVYMSGDAPSLMAKLGTGHGIAFLPKPFGCNDLLRIVREALDAKSVTARRTR